MDVKDLHTWELSPAQAVSLQKELAGRILSVETCLSPRLVAGLDCAFSRDKKRIVAAVMVLRLPELEIVESVSAILDVNFPYIPGLLSFREAPACLEAMRKLQTIPDIVLVDGQGIAHPRRLGLASHLGLFLDISTLGCAKSRLIGTFSGVSDQKGGWTSLMDKGDMIGRVVRTKNKTKPLFISIGHKVTLEQATAVVLQCCTRYRLPEPTRLAHQQVSRLRQNL